jgi:hypothetical protein
VTLAAEACGMSPAAADVHSCHALSAVFQVPQMGHLMARNIDGTVTRWYTMKCSSNTQAVPLNVVCNSVVGLHPAKAH